MRGGRVSPTPPSRRSPPERLTAALPAGSLGGNTEVALFRAEPGVSAPFAEVLHTHVLATDNLAAPRARLDERLRYKNSFR